MKSILKNTNTSQLIQPRQDAIRPKKTVRFKKNPSSSNITTPTDNAQTYMESVQGNLDVCPKEHSSLEKMTDTLHKAFDKSLSTGVQCLEKGTQFLGKKIENTAKNIMQYKNESDTSKHIKQMKDQVDHFKNFMTLGKEKIMKATEEMDEKIGNKISSLKQRASRFTKKCDRFIDKYDRIIQGKPDTLMQSIQKEVKNFKKDPVVQDFTTGMKNLKENIQSDPLIQNIQKEMKNVTQNVQKKME